MASNLIIAALLTVTVGLATYLLTRRQARRPLDELKHELGEARSAVTSAKADFDARQQELRSSISEARDRETEAKVKKAEWERKHSEIAISTTGLTSRFLFMRPMAISF